MKAIFKISLVSVFLSCILVTTSYAVNYENNSGKLIGFVYDAKTEIPIEFATVTVYKLPDSLLITGTITDNKGKFELKDIPFGNYFIVIQYLGYEKHSINSTKIFEKIIDLKFIYLNESSNELDEITISATKNIVEQKIDKKVINVSLDIASIGGTATDVLVNNALVKTNSDGDVLLRNSSSFIVLIDGKPSPFEGADALNQIQASEIDKIELITNPSAKYDAEGVTGIINIITKKQRFKGVSGIVNTSYSTNNAFSSDFILNYKNNKLNFFVGADYKKHVTNVKFDIDRTYSFADTLYYREEFIEQTLIRPNPSVKFGFDYQINPKTNISFTNTSGTASNLDKTKSVHNKHWSNYNADFGYLANNEDGNMQGFFSTPSLTFLHNFNDKGTKLSTDISYTYVDGSYNFLSKEFYTDEFFKSIDNSPSLLNSLNSYTRNFIEAKTDFTWVIDDKTTFETGAEFSDNKREVALDITNFDYTVNQWLTNLLYSNNYIFRQRIYASYLLLSGHFANFEYQIGLRGEYTDRILEQKLKNKNYLYQKLHFFPSFSLLKHINKKVQLQLSYSRRISRPIDFHLNPFPSTISSSVISRGNPELQPDLPNSFEFNISTDFNSFTLNINNFYIYTENASTQVIALNEQGTQILTFENMNFNRFIGSEISTTFTLFKILKLSPSTNIYSMESKGMIDDYNADYKTITYDFSLNSTLKIAKSTKLQIVAVYSGKTVTQQGYLMPYYFVNASLKQDFFAEKLSITLQARNLFNSNKLKFDEFGQNFHTKLDYRLETNIFAINISYKFNNFKKNALMQEKTIVNEI